MFSKVLNYPTASTTTNAHSRFVASSSAAVSSSTSTRSSSFNYDNLRLDDILCAVCQSVLNEPVFLPCQHLFCRNCIRGTIETNNLYCPCCRKRFGTWYRNASRANELVHEQLWQAIQSQFREHLDEDTPSGSSKGSTGHQVKPQYSEPPTIHLANPGEIQKEYKDELKRVQKEILEEKTKELTASEQYIINLYKQEGIIDLADNSSHVSVSSATTPDLVDGGAGGEKGTTTEDLLPTSSGAAVAGPSTIRKPTLPNPIGTLNNGTKASTTFNPISPSTASVISISSTSSAASGVTASSCATSSASGRYSLIKSVAQKVGRSAEIVKQKVQDTLLHGLTAGKLQQHQRTLNAIDLNKSDLCVKPTAVHKLERRGVEGEPAECDDSDSLKSEQNHFIPIVQSMPKSSFSCNTFRRVPTVRPVPSPLKYESSPKTSSFQPLKHKRSLSAFKVVKLEILTPPSIPWEEVGEQSSTSKKKVPTSTPRPRGRPRRIKLKFTPTKTQKTPPAQKDANAVSSTNGRTRRTVAARPNTLKDIIVSDQQRREQQIEMERRDFEFAQKLQQKLNRSLGVMQEIQRQQPPVHRSTAGYSLRRKGPVADCDTSSTNNSVTSSSSSSSSSSTTKKPAQSTRKRKATSSSVENDVPSSSSPAKRVTTQMKTRRQTRQIRMVNNGGQDSSPGEQPEHRSEEHQQKRTGTVVPLRKSTRNKTR
uniref:RING-type E3 ubiquitin transferase n=1 Tax=Anopheles maculatus TaxID=74869 RepID=A0A182SEY9_9DIPT